MLKRVLDRAVLDRAIPSNPCVVRAIRLPRRPTKSRPVLSPTEVEELAQATRTPRDRLLIRMLAYAGLRIGEALALRRRDVDLERKLLTVRQSVGEVNGHLVVGSTRRTQCGRSPCRTRSSASSARTWRASRRRRNHCCSPPGPAGIAGTAWCAETPGTLPFEA